MHRHHAAAAIEKAAVQNGCVVENAVSPAASEVICAAEDLACKVQETHKAAVEKEPVKHNRRASDHTHH